MSQEPRDTSRVRTFVGKPAFGAFASTVVAEFLSAYFAFVLAARVATPNEVSDRRRQEWCGARGTLDLPPGMKRKRGAAVRSRSMRRGSHFSV